MDRTRRRRLARLTGGLALSVTLLVGNNVDAQSNQWVFWNTFWTDFSIGNFWGYRYVCGLYYNPSSSICAGVPNSNIVVCSYAGQQIALGCHGSGVDAGQALAHVAMGAVSGPSGTTYEVLALSQSGELLAGTLPDAAPVPDPQGSIDLATVTWLDMGPIPGGGAGLDIAFANDGLASGTLYVVGQDFKIYAFTPAGEWVDTTGGNAVQIGWSPSRQTLWALTYLGRPYEGVPQWDGTLQWMERVGVPSWIPWCGTNPTYSSPRCVISVGGNAMAVWYPSERGLTPMDMPGQWDSLANHWTQIPKVPIHTGFVSLPMELVSPEPCGTVPPFNQCPPGISKVLEGGIGPNGGQNDILWVRSSATLRLYSYVQ